MIDTPSFFAALLARDVDFFCGVPDSLLKDFCAYVTDRTAPDRHVITANEGGAIALASGYHLATGRTPLVYLQNSGQGNVINPLMSLADPAVYAIPMLLLVGWRGEPGKPDEPQHVRQGAVTLSLFDAAVVPYAVLPDTTAEAVSAINEALDRARAESRPVALIARSGAFSQYALKDERRPDWPLTRESAIELVLDHLGPEDAVVATTGMTSRELFELRERRGESHERDLLTVGSMGHCSQIALGMALARPDRRIVCLDGDGSVLMHMGSIPIIGSRDAPNLRHIVINNGAHDSVGGQPTVAMEIDLPAIARASGYPFVARAETEREVHDALVRLLEEPGPGLLEIRVRRGARADLGRPTVPPARNKEAFKRFLSERLPPIAG